MSVGLTNETRWGFFFHFAISNSIVRAALKIYHINKLVTNIIPDFMAKDWLLYSYIQKLNNK